MNVMQADHLAREPGLVARLAQAAEDADLLLVHWKSNNRLEVAAAGGDDLDLSIPPEQEGSLREILEELGFLQFLSRPWHRTEGVSDWLGLDAATGALIHVHLHTRLVTGADGVMEQDLPWLDLMNRAVRKDAATGLRVPPRAFDAHLLFAREAVKSRNLRALVLRMLGRDPVAPSARDEMSWLMATTDPSDLEQWGVEMWGEARWSRMRPDFREGHLWAPAPFGRLRAEVLAALRPHRTGFPALHGAIYLRMRLIKHLHGLHAAINGTTRSGKHLMAERAPIVAFVGSDGAGKSTVTRDVNRWLSKKADVGCVYLGINHGWFLRLRSLALTLLRRHKRKASRRGAGSSHRSAPVPTTAQALKRAFSARVRLFYQAAACRLAAAGTVVLADRYPQNEVCGACDGPSPLDPPGRGRWARILQKDEHRSFARLAAVRPDLVIRLSVPLEVALSRKGDHDPALLARKVEAMPLVGFNGAPIVEVDSSQPLDVVINQARRHVWQAMQAAAGKRRAIH